MRNATHERCRDATSHDALGSGVEVLTRRSGREEPECEQHDGESAHHHGNEREEYLQRLQPAGGGRHHIITLETLYRP